MSILKTYSDLDMIRELTRRGYTVRHMDEARKPLSWHRTLPFPEGVDFRSEALEKLREQLTADHIQFTTRQAIDGPEIQSATLRVL